jgi:hypothetical protein
VNDRERIAVLEQELAALKSKFEPKPRPARVEEGARIITGREAEGSSAFVMPSAAEMEKLYAIVIGKFPQLGPHVPRNKRWVEDEKLEHFEAFVRAFRALGDLAAATHWTRSTRQSGGSIRPMRNFAQKGDRAA